MPPANSNSPEVVVNTSNLTECLAGSVAVALTGALILAVGHPTVYAPTPIFLVLFAWFLSVWALLILPTIFFLTSFVGLQFRRYPAFVLGMALTIAGFDAWYLSAAWELGIKWQGATHTYAVTVLNVLALAAVIVVAALGLHKQSLRLAKIAHLGLFFVMSWCAFPYLGELP